VLDALRETGLYEESIIFFTTDHGPAFPRMKCTLYDTGIGVSFIMDYPDNPARGQALDTLVSQVDVFPTLCELLGFDPPDYLQGVSFAPALRGETDMVRDEIYSEVSYHAAYEPMRCIRTDRYKLIRFFDEEWEGHVSANTDPSPSKTMYRDAGWMERPRAKEMLFDLWLDPVERENVADDPQYAEVYNSLSIRLREWMEQTDDPLLKADKGRIVPPAGAKINTRTSVHAHDPEREDWGEL
jgi:arylsulfatase A-like enzyme